MKKIGILFMVSLLVLLGSCSFGKENKRLEKEVSKNETKELGTLVNMGKYKESIEQIEKKGIENLSKKEKVQLAALYLKYGNSFYDEEIYSKKAIDILEKFTDSEEKFYYLGYAHEIIKKYDVAITYYNAGLELSEIDNNWKSIFLTQIGHIYDLKGDFEQVNVYYQKAEELGENLSGVFFQRGRTELRVGNYENAEKYFTKVIETEKNKFTLSEVYSNLASIYLLKGDLEKSQEYAKKGIKEQKEYPNNYIILAQNYIKKGGDDNLNTAKTNLEKAIELYPKSAYAYKYLGICNYIQDDFKSAIVHFQKQLENSKIDITLMENQRKTLRESAIYDLSRVYALDSDLPNSIKYLNLLLENGKSKTYYTQFLLDISKEKGVYSNIINEEEFKKAFLQIAKSYK